MDWNAETIARIRVLWAEGHSTAEIGRRIGVSKNAVVGKAHRLNLPPRPSPIRRDGKVAPRPRNPQPRRVIGPTLPSLAAADLVPDAGAEPAPDPTPDVAAAAEQAPAGRPDVAAQTAPEPEIVSPPAAAPQAASPQAQRQPPHPSQPQPEPGFQPPAPPAPKPAPVRVVTQRPSRLVACCWPLGEPGTKTFHFCDAEATPGKPYCQAHAQLAYVKVRDRREDAA